MKYHIEFHKEAKKELDRLDGSARKLVLKQIIKLQRNPGLGETLGNKAGYDLTGYRKLYADIKRIRIIYKIETDMIIVFILAIGKREDLEIYRTASSRK